jgi:hypothetical protein
MRVAICALFLVLGAQAQEPKKDEEAAKETVATLRARTLDQAVKTYYLKEGRWPAALGDVAAFLEEGKKGLLSPWGIPYQYTLRERDGQVVFFVWTDREVNGKVRVYGNKPPEEKKKR